MSVCVRGARRGVTRITTSTQQALEGHHRRARRLGALEAALRPRPSCPSALMELRSGQRTGHNMKTAPFGQLSTSS